MTPFVVQETIRVRSVAFSNMGMAFEEAGGVVVAHVVTLGLLIIETAISRNSVLWTYLTLKNLYPQPTFLQ
jgi:hypothetical protein